MKKPVRVYLTSLDQPENLGQLHYFPNDPLNSAQVKKLRAYTKIDKIISKKKTDFAQALSIAEFTSEAWGHDGLNSNPKKQDALTILKLADRGASFACVQFASVFVQLCQSVGIPARVLQVRTKHPDLGSSGHGHVTAEYFDNQLSKWVWIDPQIHSYATYKNKLLGLNELAELVIEGKKPNIKFTTRTVAYVKGDKKRFKDLEIFVKRYVWFAKVGGLKSFYSNQKNITTIACKRKGILPAVTFQGFAEKTPVFVSKEVFDAPLNSCQFQFETTEPSIKPEWIDLQDYKDNAHLSFATRDLNIYLTHSMPWFSHYEILFNGRKINLKNDKLKVRLVPGKNTIEVYPVNQAKRKGVSSKAVIYHDEKYKNVKNFW
jgi:hypothetical protein